MTHLVAVEEVVQVPLEVHLTVALVHHHPLVVQP
jgi:hypothetical protein